MKFILYSLGFAGLMVGLIDLCIAVAGTRWSMLVAVVLFVLAVQVSRVTRA